MAMFNSKLFVYQRVYIYMYSHIELVQSQNIDS